MRILLSSNKLNNKHQRQSSLNYESDLIMNKTVSISIFCNIMALLLIFFIAHKNALAANLEEQFPNPTENSVSDRSLRPFQAVYTAFRSNKEVGDVELKLSNEHKNHYELFYRSDISKFFLTDQRQETTFFITSDNQLKPVKYEYKRTGTGPNKDLTLEFDHVNNIIDVNNEKKIPWQGEFENQLFRIDVPYKLSIGETEIVYDFVNYRGQKRQYKLNVMGSESLSLPYGTLNALKVKIERKSNSRVTFAWFAPTLNHNLVRLQQFKDDKEQGDMLLARFRYL